MNELKLFDFQTNQLRVVVKDGEPWFVATDVCAPLGLGNVTMALARLDDDEKGVSSIDTLGGPQQLAVVSEAGLYVLVLGSRKPKAKEFKRWVAHEVLPSIRKTGSYNAPALDIRQLINDPGQLRTLAVALIGRNEELEQQNAKLEHVVAEQAVPVRVFHTIAASDDTYCLRDAAKILQQRPTDLMSWLSTNKWIYRRVGKKSWLAYQDKIQRGVLVHKVSAIPREEGAEKIVEQVRVTGKGLTVLGEVFHVQVNDTLKLTASHPLDTPARLAQTRPHNDESPHCAGLVGITLRLGRLGDA